VFGGWYDEVRPLLHRRSGLKFQLPDPVYTEVKSTGAVLDRIFIFVVSNPSILAAANFVVITTG